MVLFCSSVSVLCCGNSVRKKLIASEYLSTLIFAHRTCHIIPSIDVDLNHCFFFNSKLSIDKYLTAVGCALAYEFIKLCF